MPRKISKPRKLLEGIRRKRVHQANRTDYIVVQARSKSEPPQAGSPKKWSRNCCAPSFKTPTFPFLT